MRCFARNVLFGLAVMLAPAPVLAEAPTQIPAATAGTVSTFTLDNGMDVVVIEDHRAPIVVHMVWYRAGSADEPPGASGIAHFLEHLMFKGTETMESGAFSKLVQDNGGSGNAFTSYDYTAYFQRIAADRLPLMMEKEADRMTGLRLTKEEIATEREVILEERNMRTDSEPRALLSEQMNAALYLNHPYGVPVIGWRHEMEALDQAKARAFYDRFYAPNNAILIVGGDVTPDAVRALAEKTYGQIPARADLPERVRPQEPPQLAPRRMTLIDPRVAQPSLTRSYLGAERNPGDQRRAAAQALLADLLGGGQTSVLTRKLQFDTQVATWTGAYASPTSVDASSFDLVVVPAQDVSLEKAEAALDAALAAFLTEGVDADDLARIKRQYRASEIYERDSAHSMAYRYGMGLATGLTLADIAAWPELLQEITAEEILTEARALFDSPAQVTGWLMPEEEANQ